MHWAMKFYYLIANGECQGKFILFSDAWACAQLLNRYSIISHPKEGYWVINPASTN